MVPNERGSIIEPEDSISVTYAKQLSDKLAKLSAADLQLLRRYLESNDLEKMNEILTKVSIKDFNPQDLKVALAMLDGVHRLPLVDKPLGYDSTQIWEPKLQEEPLPPHTVITPPSESPAKLSVTIASEIADLLAEIPRADLLWLADHLTDSHDKRSRLLFINYQLYRYRLEDVAAGIAALRRTLPPVPPDSDEEELSDEY
ncbi:MAG: hypothetical protein ACFFDP_03185 [Promethearchaeota archaeon]